MQDRTYQPPQIADLGTVADLTQGGASGLTRDATFPAGTPFTDLTFS